MTGISGSGVGDRLRSVEQVAREDHGHLVKVHDVGQLMRDIAKETEHNINWDHILDGDSRALRFLRAHALSEVAHEVRASPDTVHLVDIHLCFRWSAYLTRGLEPHTLAAFAPHVRCFINVVADLAIIQERLRQTSWGERKILELLVWRDEELFLSTLFADICGRVDCFAVAEREPPSEIEKLVWHPDIRKVYLSFPITEILDDDAARKEIEDFRDRIREFLVVFDPYVCKDYDETYKRPEMEALRKPVGETTVERDYRFIDQADAVVVYFPRRVPSKGVDAEMNHARRTGKPIFLYCPEDLGGGPFAVPPSHYRDDPTVFVELLKEELTDGGGGGQA